MQGNSAPAFTNVLISGNTAAGTGGGIYWASSGNPVLNNTTLTANSAGYRGGGIYLAGQSVGIIGFRNSILWGNLAGDSQYPGKQVFTYSGTIQLYHCCYANNPGDMQITVGFYDIANCITSDPLFADAPNGDYRLTGASPCTDVGNNTYNALGTDIRGTGFGRKLVKTNYTQEGTIDMGAYEYNSATDPTGCINPVFSTDGTDPTCPGGSDGEIYITITTADQGPYTFSINNGSDYDATFIGTYPNYTLTGLPAGIHKIRAKDNYGCESEECP
jgi:parallel beta-helix repeat protein